MKREQALQQRLHALHNLSEAVVAMKSLATQHFRTAHQALPAARAYRQGLDDVLAAVGLSQEMHALAPPGLLLVAADLGLCGDYNARLAQAALAAHTQHGVGVVYSIGRRPLGALTRAGIAVQHLYTAPTSVAGLTRILLEVAQDLFEAYRTGYLGGLYVVSARFEGVGTFTPVCTQLLPPEPVQPVAPVRPSPYVSTPHLAVVVGREFLYITLYEIFLDALASEHSARLVAAESADQWLDSQIAAVHRTLAASRRELATQEVLDLAASGKQRQRPPPLG
jgi:F-type H+-transporting ATPase subunit gamma